MHIDATDTGFVSKVFAADPIVVLRQLCFIFDLHKLSTDQIR